MSGAFAKYSEAEDAQLAELFVGGATWAEIANALGRTPLSVRQRGYKLNLRRYENGNRPKENPAHRTVLNRRYQEKYPEKRAAHKAVEHALLSGDLVKEPCEFCGCVDVAAHHANYERPLDVNWLCSSCHARLHTIMRKNELSPCRPTLPCAPHSRRGAFLAG